MKVKSGLAVAAAAQNDSGKYNDPNYFVVKNTAQTVIHSITVSLHEKNPF